MSQKLVNRNWDLIQLRADGYDVTVKRPVHLLIRHVHYVNANQEVKRGILVSELDLASDVTVPPKNHVAFLIGEYPRNADGTSLEGLSEPNQVVDKDLTLNFQISRKPKLAPYPDYYAKMRTHIDILTAQEQIIEPGVTAKTHPVVVPADGESVFNYLDTAATKAGIIAANTKLEKGKVAIVGVGGTGAYVFDLVRTRRSRRFACSTGTTS